ncbi:DUF305 domain-containing protein [Massilia glaciei]|uniref:DUF305 domain-containing protein n=1 Tax=Massilia glaciei TaxID=1524097 RepID=A0A2U2HLP8_9BURK|nr:DUF305 domain-containing protein [Massilia glaciei]PWF48448.1 DUF305 domain-containing protein [Massilia glaciei]
MKLPQTWIKNAMTISAAAALMVPILAVAQGGSPSPHQHATVPAGSSTAPAHDMMSAMTKMQTEMATMKMSGDIDHDFAMMMVSHHQGAIDMAKVELARGKNKQLKQMAGKMIADQTKEISKLNKWMAQHSAIKK